MEMKMLNGIFPPYPRVVCFKSMTDDMTDDHGYRVVVLEALGARIEFSVKSPEEMRSIVDRYLPLSAKGSSS